MKPSLVAAARTRSPAPAPAALAPAPTPLPLRALDGVRQPLYVSLARALMQEIDSGRYAVGSLLPTEDSLSLRHGVSRHTVRQALRELKEEGVIWSRPGVGTRVRARSSSGRFFSGINTVADLLQFVETTEMHVLSRAEVIADDDLADQLRCKPGQAWHEITILRRLPQQKLPLSYLQVYMRPEFAAAAGPQKLLTRPIYSLVEERFGIRIIEVQQEITAANLTSIMAKALKAKEGQAAMRITRYYLDRNGTVIQVGIGHYPSGRYTQRSRLREQNPEGEDVRGG